MNQLTHLLRYKSWANDALFATLADLATEVLEAKRSIVFGSIARTLNHNYTMDRVWRAHLEGGSHGYVTRNPADCPPLDELRDHQSRIDAWYSAYAENLPPELAAEVVDFEFIGGGVGRMSRSEILFHVVNHATYHRGHVAAMLYESGIAPPTTDFPVYLRESGTGPSS